MSSPIPIVSFDRVAYSIVQFADGSTWFWQLNTGKPPLANLNIRKAIALAVNRKSFLAATLDNRDATPLFGLIPGYMPGTKGRYIDEFPWTATDGNAAAAKDALAAGLKEIGQTALRPLTILGIDNPEQSRQIAFFATYFKEVLGIEIKADLQDYKGRLEKGDRRDFDFAWSGWAPDFMDPITFAAVFTSSNPFNQTGWKSPAYDQLLDQANETLDPRKRMTLISQAEHILIDSAAVVPLYTRTASYCVNPRIDGIVRHPVGVGMDFYFAKFIATPAH